MLKCRRLFNFIPHLKDLRNTDTDSNLTFHIARVIFTFTNQELNKNEYQNRNHSYQTVFYRVLLYYFMHDIYFYKWGSYFHLLALCGIPYIQPMI